MDWLFIQTVAINSLVFAAVGTFIMRMRHKALQKKAGTDTPFPMMRYFIFLLIGMFIFLNLISYLVAGKPMLNS